MKLKKKLIIIAAIGLILSSNYALATTITNDTGLPSPTNTITFDEFVFPQNTVVDTQYSSLGVTFTSGLQYDAQGSASFPGINGHYLGNFSATNNPFSIFFTENQTSVAFGFATNPTNTTFSALINGSVIESFTIATTFDSINAYHGFTDILFDEISVNVSNISSLIDNIQLGTTAPVPEPTTMLLLGTGLVGVAGAARKKKKNQA